MKVEKARIVNAEDEQEAVGAMVQKAFKLWSENSTNLENAERMNSALDEAYGTGVRISVKVEQKALDSPEVVNQKRFNELKKLDPWMQKNAIVINSETDNPRFSRIYRGQVLTTEETGFLSLDVLIGDIRENLANLKPDEIVSLTPIPTTR